MLILSMEVDQVVVIGDNIEVVVVEVRGKQVRLGVKASRNVSVLRKELIDQIRMGIDVKGGEEDAA